MGATRFPARQFALYDVLACTLWASYCAGVGYVGGRLFSQHPIVGVLTGMGIAMTVATTIEVIQRRRERRAVRPADDLVELAAERDVSPAA